MFIQLRSIQIEYAFKIVVQGIISQILMLDGFFECVASMYNTVSYFLELNDMNLFSTN